MVLNPRPHRGGVLLSLLFRLIKIAVLALMVGVVLLLVFVKQKGKEVIFSPFNSSQGNWEVSKYGGFEDCSFTGEKGIMLHGWFFQTSKAAANPVILWCRGSVGNITLHFDHIKLFQQTGFDVFIFDYRGYGKSQGLPSEEGTYADALAAYQYLVSKRNIDARQIVIFGQSLGGAIAVRLASQNLSARALVLEATPDSLPALIKDKIGVDWPRANLPVYFVCDSIATVKIPTLIIHGKTDSVVPYSHGAVLFARSGAARKELFLIDNGGHQNCYLVAGMQYFNKIHEFVYKKP